MLKLSIPSSWNSLSPKMLRFTLSLLASSLYSIHQVKMILSLHAAGLKSVAPEKNGAALVKKHRRFFILSRDQLLFLAHSVDFIDTIPKQPFRLPRIWNRDALDPMLYGLPFGQWLAIENMYQAYISSKDQKFLEPAFNILYPYTFRSAIKPPFRCTDAVRILNVFYWIASFKNALMVRYPDLFLPAGQAQDPITVSSSMRTSMESQIRALSKGDITKNEAILATDIHSALSELNALARETRELKQKIKH